MSCTDRGRPNGPVLKGSAMQGVPKSVQKRLKIGIAGIAQARRRLALGRGREQDVELAPGLVEMDQGAALALARIGILPAADGVALGHHAVHGGREEVGEAPAFLGVGLRRLLGHDAMLGLHQAFPAVGRVPFAHARAGGAQGARGLLDVLPVVALGHVPPRRADQADARRPLRSWARRIGGGMAVGGADQRQVVGLAGEEAQRVEAGRIGLDAGHVGPAVAALVGHDAVEGARPDHRARGLRAVAHRRHEVGDGRRRARRGAGRRVAQVVRIVRLAGMAAGEFGGHRLAQHDGARLHELRDAGGVLADDMVAVDRRAAGRGHGLGRDDVLHRQRNAVQGADGADPLVEHVGPLARAVGVERLPGMDLALAGVDAVEAGLDQVAGLQPLLGHAQHGLAGRQPIGRSRHVSSP